MHDDNCSHDSGGIIGGIISLLILAAIWPYLLAMVCLYIAYLAAIAIWEWITQNPLIVISLLLGVFASYLIMHYRLIPKAWNWVISQLKPKSAAVNLAEQEIAEDEKTLEQRAFIPSTNLYCYWCTKKLGIKAWENQGKYYCEECMVRQSR